MIKSERELGEIIIIREVNFAVIHKQLELMIKSCNFRRSMKLDELEKNFRIE